MYVKIIDKYSIEKAPVLLRDEHKTYANPLPDVLRRFGYLPLITAQEPDDGNRYEKQYASDGSSVFELWVPVPDQEPELDPSPAHDGNTEEESENETDI